MISKPPLIAIALILGFLGMLGCGITDPIVKKDAQKPQMVPAARWQESLPSGAFRSQTPERITVLQSGGNAPTGDRENQIKLLHKKELQKGHGHLSAHFYMDPDGGIYEGRQMFLQGRWPDPIEMDASGHVMIMVLGNFNTQTLSEEFKSQFLSLATWLIQHYEIPVENLHGLNHYIRIDNPGRNLREWLESEEFYQGLMAKTLDGYQIPTPHPTVSPTPVTEK